MAKEQFVAMGYEEDGSIYGKAKLNGRRAVWDHMAPWLEWLAEDEGRYLVLRLDYVPPEKGTKIGPFD